MMRTKKPGRTLSVLLAILLLVSITPLTTFAQNSTSELQARTTIRSFEALSSEVAVQSVSVGTEKSALVLPETLFVTVEGANTCLTSVTWHSLPTYDSVSVKTPTSSSERLLES